MAIHSRSDLQGFFSKGKRPKQEEFWHWIDSFYHKTEDTINLTGWSFRSFFKDLRSEGVTNLTTGGTTVVEIPFSVSRLKRLKIMGKGALNVGQASFKITVNLQYSVDKSVSGLIGVPSNGNTFPPDFFTYPLIGLGSNPIANFEINSTTPHFSGIFDFAAIPLKVLLDFNQARFFSINISITNGSFPTGAGLSFVYYGFEYE